MMVDGRWVEDPLVRNDPRAVSSGRRRVPQLDHARRRSRRGRAGRLRGGARPLPPLRLARLPVGAPDADLPQAEGTGARHLALVRARVHGRRRLDVRRRAGVIPDPSTAPPTSTRSTRRRAGLLRPRHRARAVRQGDAHDRVERVVRDHPDDELGLRRRRREPATTTIPTRCAARSTASTPRSTSG